MNVLVTGDRGYWGSVLCPHLLRRGHRVVGLDAGWFAACALTPEPAAYPRHTLDLRDLSACDLAGHDAVIHLAALSNDPLGELDPELTHAVNCYAAVRLAVLARQAGVPRLVFASSQSLYGFADGDAELGEDSPQRPQTAYAESKAVAENWLLALGCPGFAVTCLRPATLFGASPRLRCDIVFNSLLASAYTTGRAEVRTDGTPWRPVVHIDDACAAVACVLEAPARRVAGRVYNLVGGNHSVRDLAEEARRLVPGSGVVYTGELADRRSYRVSAERIKRELGWAPRVSLEEGGRGLLDWFGRAGFAEENYRGPACNRLARVKELMARGELDGGLRWAAP